MDAALAQTHRSFPLRRGEMPLVAVLVHMARVEVVDALVFNALFPLVDVETLVGFDAADKLRVSIGERWTEVPAENVG